MTRIITSSRARQPAASPRHHQPQERFQVFTRHRLRDIPRFRRLPDELQREVDIVARVLPFRVNGYVADQLIDWDAAPDDPMFRLVFPQRDMLEPAAFDRLARLVDGGADEHQVARCVQDIRRGLNPHPAGQMELNVPELDGVPLPGLQHKYRETVLFFPGRGQVCHAYCTFCFRWAQFVGDRELRFSATDTRLVHAYLRRHPEVSDLLVTGGDPMVMSASNLQRYLLPLTGPDLAHVRNVRIGTKSLTFWPQRFVTDADADELLRLLEALVAQGRQVAIMAHYNHWRELDTDIARQAIARIRGTGAVIRAQGPLLAHINDDPSVWARLWEDQVRAGIVPYYLFVERDTGARRYFEVPLARAWQIYREAMQQVSGLARTARGPSMSAAPGKVEVQGIAEIRGEKVFVLRFIQGRNADWVQRPFFARFDPDATWLDQLRPAFGEDRFFYEDEWLAMGGGSVTAPAGG
jgi:KamA family protein